MFSLKVFSITAHFKRGNKTVALKGPFSLQNFVPLFLLDKKSQLN